MSLLWFCLFVFRDKVSLWSPECAGTHSVDLAVLELSDPPASASRVLGGMRHHGLQGPEFNTQYSCKKKVGVGGVESAKI